MPPPKPSTLRRLLSGQESSSSGKSISEELQDDATSSPNEDSMENNPTDLVFQQSMPQESPSSTSSSQSSLSENSVDSNGPGPGTSMQMPSSSSGSSSSNQSNTFPTGDDIEDLTRTPEFQNAWRAYHQAVIRATPADWRISGTLFILFTTLYLKHTSITPCVVFSIKGARMATLAD